MSENDEKFEQVDSGASDFYPLAVGSVKNGSYVVIQNRPCKVVHIDTFKVGKHGSAKANITGIDIFNEKKMLVNLPCSANINVPIINKSSYTAIYIDEEGFITLMDKQGKTRQDLKLPDETENDKNLSARIREWMSGGKEIISVTVTKSLKIEKVTEAVIQRVNN